MLLTIDALLNADELQTDTLASEPGELGQRADKRRRTGGALSKTILRCLLTMCGFQSCAKIVTVALQRSPIFHRAVLPLKVLPPFFNRYAGTANTYGLHIDNAMRICADGSHVRTDISCTLFLSEPTSYEGGELVIEGGVGAPHLEAPGRQSGHLSVQFISMKLRL